MNKQFFKIKLFQLQRIIGILLMTIPYMTFVLISIPIKGQESSIEACLDSYKEVLEISKRYTQEQFYFNFRVQYITNDKPSPFVNYEIWGNDKKYKIIIDNLTIFQDETNQILISEEQKTILIRPVENTSVYNDFFSIQGHLTDSLNKYVKRLECIKENKHDKLIIEFNPVFYNRYKFKRIEIEYDKNKKQIIRGIYDYKSISTKEDRLVYEYLEFNNDIEENVSFKNVLDLIFPEDAVYGLYKNYTIKDLRVNPLIRETL